VTGPIEAVLYVSSSAPDTDFTAKLVDVAPDGFAMNLTDGIVRVSRRDGGAEPEFIEPGEVVEVRIDLGNTSNLFRAGHQIRLEVSSSNFPRFSRHTNTREQPELAGTPRVAEQTVHHGGAHRSRLILPVLPTP
jgi:putative CocE/NonD family hydrolase